MSFVRGWPMYVECLSATLIELKHSSSLVPKQCDPLLIHKQGRILNIVTGLSLLMLVMTLVWVLCNSRQKPVIVYDLSVTAHRETAADDTRSINQPGSHWVNIFMVRSQNLVSS